MKNDHHEHWQCQHLLSLRRLKYHHWYHHFEAELNKERIEQFIHLIDQESDKYLHLLQSYRLATRNYHVEH
jgi:hypothetical protein